MTLIIQLLGGLQITHEGGIPSPIMKWAKGEALLTYLVVSGEPQRREFLADLLWDSDSTAQSLQNLRKLISRIKKWLPELEIERQQIGLKPNADIWVDLHDLDEKLNQSGLGHQAQTVTLYRGEFLSGFYLNDAPRFNEWVTVERERLHRKISFQIKSLCEGLFEEKMWELGSEVAQHWTLLDEFDEEASQWLIRFLGTIGKITEARLEFERLEAAFNHELKITPSEETWQLFEQVIAEAKRRSVTRNPETNTTNTPIPFIRKDWGEAPKVSQFVGRKAEINQLSHWILEESARIITILGIGGQGKSALAIAISQHLSPQFETVFWRSLVNAPPLNLILKAYIHFLNPEATLGSNSVSDQLTTLRQQLEHGRHLLILDNLETILDKEDTGQFKEPYADYEQLFTLIGSTHHQNVLLVTSREAPFILHKLSQTYGTIYQLPLSGLNAEVTLSMLQQESTALDLTPQLAQMLTQRYSGNPLALKLVAKTIEDYYFGDIDRYLADNGAIFEDIRKVLDQQFNRLSALEQEILLWLAIRREATTPTDLDPLILTHLRPGELIKGMQRLQRRSLLEREANGFILQNVVTEYLTDHLITQIGSEAWDYRFAYLNRYSLILVEAKEYVRQSQERIFLGGVGQEISKKVRTQADLKTYIATLLEQARRDEVLSTGYLAGNLLNLLVHLKVELNGLNFSELHLRQIYLRNVWANSVDFSYVKLKNAVFNDTFGLIFSMAYRPDGKVLAIGTKEGDIYFWKLRQNSPTSLIKRFVQHPNDPDNTSLPAQVVRTVTFSPDGSLVAAGTYNYSVRIWDYQQGIILHTLHTECQEVGFIAFSADGRLLATGYDEFGVAIWDVATGGLLHVFYDHKERVRGLAFHPQQLILATASNDSSVRLWDIEAGKLIAQLNGHENFVGSLAWSPDGKWIASGSGDKTIRLWDVSRINFQNPDRVPSKILTGHTGYVTSVSFHPNSNQLVSSSIDHTVRIWDIPSGKLRHILQQHSNAVYVVASNPNGLTFASGGVDLSLIIWDQQSGQPIYRRQGAGRLSRSIAFDPSSKKLLSGSIDKIARIWHLDSLDLKKPNRIPHQSFSGHTEEIYSVAYSHKGHIFATAGLDKTIRIWRADTGKLVRVLEGLTDTIWSIHFSADDRFLASTDSGHVVSLWDVERGRLTHHLEGHTGWVYDSAFHPEGTTLVSVGIDTELIFWDVETGHRYYSL
ncbi:MAG: NB-ARC domain-containing protein, partial [Chloroflexota bacterium]